MVNNITVLLTQPQGNYASSFASIIMIGSGRAAAGITSVGNCVPPDSLGLAKRRCMSAVNENIPIAGLFTAPAPRGGFWRLSLPSALLKPPQILKRATKI